MQIARSLREPDALFEMKNPEIGYAEHPQDMAEYLSQYMTRDEIFEVEILCARELPARTMRVWWEQVDEDEYVPKWEWI